MKFFPKKLTLKQIVDIFSLTHTFKSDISNISLDNVAELGKGNKSSLSFCESPKFTHLLKTSESGIKIIPPKVASDIGGEFIISDDPYFIFTKVIYYWIDLCETKKEARISSKSTISPSAIIGKNSVIDDFIYIGENVKIGDNCHIYPNVSIYKDTIIGNNVTIHSGVVIGADGYGFLYKEGIQNKIPQIGNVIIGNDVEIGANSCV